MKPASLAAYLLSALVVSALHSSPLGEEEWTGHRGGSSRTGNIDGKPGPAAPKVLWVHRSKEQFLPERVPPFRMHWMSVRSLPCTPDSFQSWSLSPARGQSVRNSSQR